MEANESKVKSENNKRKGIHKFFHISRFDSYFGAVGAIVFLVIVILKVIGGWEISFISWSDALQIGILFGILGIVAQLYYNFFEERYDN